MQPIRIEHEPGQESVWDYPRPPRLEPCDAHVVVTLGGLSIADTTRSIRVLETSQPPAFYIPSEDIDFAALRPSSARTMCEWKGEAAYYDLCFEGTEIEQIAWTYRQPTPAFTDIATYIAFYAQKLDCSVDGEQVTANEGTFYGGWITSKVKGPFKGGPGSAGW